MSQLREDKSPLFDEELLELACGPIIVETYSGCHMNRVKFMTAEQCDKLYTKLVEFLYWKKCK